ncbi:MAG: hypothetical protein AB7K71_36940 [Polyangiaceae bacterium]
MTTAWEMATTMADKHANSGGIFVRLANNGDKIVGAFCGEPYAREVIWTGERYEQFDENNSAHQGKRPSLRVMLNFYVPAEGAMKVIEGGTVWFKDVLKVRDKYGLDKWLFEIERHGDAGDPKTTYSILPEEKLDDEMRARIAAAEAHDLKSIGTGNDEDAGSKGSTTTKKSSNAAGPIDPRVAGDLVAKLKALPRSDVDAFLAEFGVQRVRDLDAKHETAARAFIDQLLAKQSQPEEVDPFA